MNFEEIKEIIKKDQGKFIIVEDGKPVMVILSFGDYQKILNLRSGEREESEKFVPIGETIQETKEDFISEPLHGESETEEEESAEVPPELEEPSFVSPSEATEGEEPLKIEDLPF